MYSDAAPPAFRCGDSPCSGLRPSRLAGAPVLLDIRNSTVDRPMNIFARLGLCVLLVSGPGGGALAQPTLDAQRFGDALGAVHPPDAHAIASFYSDRAHRAVWADTDGLSPAGQALTDLLRRADDEALDPDEYVVALRGSLEAREAALAAAFLRFTRDLTQGRADPAGVYRDWDARPRRFDPSAALLAAVENGPEGAVRRARPAHAAYHHLRVALVRYRLLDAAGGWPTIPDGPSLHPGDSSLVVPILRQRLLAEGFEMGASGEGALYDSGLEGVVRDAQARFGLVVDGIVGPATRGALNVTAAERIRQIGLNMERWRWMPAELGERHVHINAAGMTAELVEHGRAVLTLRAIVGTVGNPTPGFSSSITSAVLNPAWYVPAGIARNEIWPRVRRDPDYLVRNHMTVLPGGTIRQAPGPSNPLGPVKFLFESRFDVRLHGTANPELFDRHPRAFSHGCIRVETPLVLAEELLRGTDWDARRIDAAIARGREVAAPLAAPVPIHVAYWTAWVAPDGSVQFRSDLYGRDRALAGALSD